jgi:cytochrome c551/c552
MNKKFRTISILASLMFLVSCLNSEKEKNMDETKLGNGFRLLETNCFSCHKANSRPKEKLIAPSFATIKKFYIPQNKTIEQFASELNKFIQDPSEAHSKIPAAIQQYGSMPKMNFSDSQVNDIAYYIFHKELESPDWMETNYLTDKEKFSKISLDVTPMERGKIFAMQTKGILGKNLMNAINSLGVDSAISFCSTKAIYLTDSVASSLNISIKRVSDRNRNPQNKANADELLYLEDATQKIKAGEKPSPQIIESEGVITGYYPIMMDKMCLKCHGGKTDIAPTTLAKIKKLYPKDKAIGYKPNELRGIWVVKMKDK